jgi:hypothetical protein
VKQAARIDLVNFLKLTIDKGKALRNESDWIGLVAAAGKRGQANGRLPDIKVQTAHPLISILLGWIGAIQQGVLGWSVLSSGIPRAWPGRTAGTLIFNKSENSSCRRYNAILQDVTGRKNLTPYICKL